MKPLKGVTNVHDIPDWSGGMVGEWIKYDHGLPRKPKLWKLAQVLCCSVNEAIGACLRFWAWVDENSEDGSIGGVTAERVDEIVDAPGFTLAMKKVGWLKFKKGGIIVPKFDRHNSQSAKRRLLTNERVKRHRNASSVTKALPEQRRAESEKIREEKDSDATTVPSHGVAEGSAFSPSRYADAAADRRSGEDGLSAKQWAMIQAGSPLTGRDWQAMPVIFRVQRIMRACGCDESYAGIIARQAQQKGAVYKLVLYVFGRYTRKRNKPKNPGGWFRVAMEQNGVRV